MKASELALVLMEYIDQRKDYHKEVISKRPNNDSVDYHLSGLVELMGIEQRIMSLIHEASENKEN